MPPTQETPQERLRRLVAKRRRELTLSISAASAAAGINRATWTAMERGQRATEEYVYGGIERALAWTPGSVDDILSGGDPTTLTGTRTPPEPESDVETRLKAIRDNPDNEPNLRRQAQAALDLIYAILDSGANGRRAG